MSEDSEKPALEEPDDLQRFYHEQHQQQQKTFSDAADLINIQAVERLRMVTEEVFKEQLLPIVRSQVRNEPNEQINLWINVANGFDNPIQVIPRSGGDPFICPPPFVKIAPLVPDRNQRYVDLRNVIMYQRALSDNSDQRGVLTIEKDLMTSLYPNPEDDVKTNSLLQLVSIYLRYELPMQELLGPQFQEILDLIKGDDTPGAPASKTAEDTYEPPESDYQY